MYMARKKRSNSQLYGIIALVSVVVVFVWAMVQMLNQNKVNTQSEAKIRNSTNLFNQIGSSGGCKPFSDVNKNMMAAANTIKNKAVLLQKFA